jgi:hypothetical protein
MIMLPPPPLYVNDSWRLHLGPPPPRRLPPPRPFVVAVVPRRPHARLDWRLRFAATLALLIAIIALGGVG